MFNVARRLALVGVGALAAAALAFPSAAGADPNGATTVQLPFATVALSGCTNEYVSITGVLHVVSQTFTDPANIFHDHFTFSLSGGKGVGIDSGIGYIMTETVTVADEEGPPPSVFMEILDSNLNGQGSAPNQNAQIRLHVTTDAQGNVTAFFDSATVTCLG